jgi:hypothetical protein
MTTVTKQRTQGLVDAVGAAPATGEDLLASVLDDDTVAGLAEQARTQGVALLGEGGLLQQLTKRFLEATLQGEMDAHLGRDRHERGGDGNARNGKRTKTLITDVGPVAIEVPGTVTARSPRRSWRSGSGASVGWTTWSSR